MAFPMAFILEVTPAAEEGAAAPAGDAPAGDAPADGKPPHDIVPNTLQRTMENKGIHHVCGSMCRSPFQKDGLNNTWISVFMMSLLLVL